MSMFDTVGQSTDPTTRKENTLRKLARMNQALRHQEPDRVPISDFFWGGFTRRWQQELGLPPDANPYYHYDLDWIVTVANFDPWIRPFETIRETAEEVTVRTGFGAIMHKHFSFPMPEMQAWDTDTFEKLQQAVSRMDMSGVTEQYVLMVEQATNALLSEFRPIFEEGSGESIYHEPIQ